MTPLTTQQIGEHLNGALYEWSPRRHEQTLLPLLINRIHEAIAGCEPYARYVSAWPRRPSDATSIAQLPYLPVSVFKQEQLLSCLPSGAAYRTVTSSSTSGVAPSRIPIDNATAKAMARGAAAILRDFIGPARRPLLILDNPAASGAPGSLTARAAAARALTPFATSTEFALRSTSDPAAMELDLDRLRAFSAAHRDRPVLLYGFTVLLWFGLVQRLRELGERIELPLAHVLHSGGWKKLTAAAVSADRFRAEVAAALGCPEDRVIDFYGMAESIGVVYPDCSAGNKHVPKFAAVIVRDPLTMAPVAEGETGMVQVCSLLPSSFPGHLLLTDDLAQVVVNDHCACGRRGLAFRLRGRVPKSDLRGCGNTVTSREAERQVA